MTHATIMSSSLEDDCSFLMVDFTARSHCGTFTAWILPVDWIVHHANHRGFLGARLGGEIFPDLENADDVALLAEMLDVLLLALDALKDKARPLGLEVNWQKTKSQTTTDPATVPTPVHISGNAVDVVESLVYLGSDIHITVLLAQNQKCVAGLAWPKADVSTL